MGFAGGDPNLYRYVGNEPTDAADSRGLIGVLFDGSGYKASDDTIISIMSYSYTRGETFKDINRNGEYTRTCFASVESGNTLRSG
jgi:hypothetical protein